ncbi:hypothetical protein ACLMJK_008640 [Lecanora helva]
MRAVAASLVFAAYLGLATAEVCNVAPKKQTDGIFSIGSPGKNNPVTAGQKTNITWDKGASTASHVDIQLCAGPGPDCKLTDCIYNGANNSGSFEYTFPTYLAPSTITKGYGILLIEADGPTPGRYQYSQNFELINPHPNYHSSAVQQISDGQVQAPTGTATPVGTTQPYYTVPGASATGTGAVGSTGLYYVAAPTGKTSNTTHSSGYNYFYGINTAPAVPINSSLVLSSTGAVNVPSTLPTVTQVAGAPGGTGVSGGTGGAGVGAPGASNTAATSPIAHATGAASNMVAGGVMAGLGALGALIL